MQKRLAIGQGVEILDQNKTRGRWFNELPPPPASLMANTSEIKYNELFELHQLFCEFKKSDGKAA